MFGQRGIAARTDYIVNGSRSCTLFLTATRSDGNEGRAFVARTEDGGRAFGFLSWIGEEPEGFSIMPASGCPPTAQLNPSMPPSEVM